MKVNNLNWMIGGEAGYGIMNNGLAFAKFCIRSGLYAFLSHDYPSLIRGGHNTSSVRVSDKKVGGHSDKLDILVALNKESIERHIDVVEDKGYLIYDGEEIKGISFGKKVQLVSVPMLKISKSISEKKLLNNSIALGASVALVDGNLDVMNKILNEIYSEKGKEVVDWNIKACTFGYDYVRKNFKGSCEIKVKNILSKNKGTKKYIISGNEAIGLGAIAAGCKFISQYPMTPTSQLLSFMASKSREYDIAVVQPEDEISSIHLAMGAAFSGVRAMTATSGGGFCLMSEGFGLAGIAEIPIVVVNGQRGGPATGLPTKHEQSDLNLVRHSGQGEIARVVLCPSDAEDAFYSAAEAFNLAERFQVPVVLLVDKYLCTNYATCENIFSNKIKIGRGLLASEEKLVKIRDFKRYYVGVKNGVSLRSIPGQKNGLHNAASDEHDEYGQLTEDPELRNKMMKKRLIKLKFIEKELPEPEIFGEKNAVVTIVGWGSTKSVIREAIGLLKESEVKVNHLHIKYLVPFQGSSVLEILKKCKRVIAVEDNYSGQLADLVREKTGIEIKERILRYDGKQFTALELKDKIMKLIKGK